MKLLRDRPELGEFGPYDRLAPRSRGDGLTSPFPSPATADAASLVGDELEARLKSHLPGDVSNATM